MYLLKKVGARSKGMGFKTMKFHSLTHIVEDTENFGVPKTLDTGELELDSNVNTHGYFDQRRTQTYHTPFQPFIKTDRSVATSPP